MIASLKNSSYEFSEKISKLKLGGLQQYTGITGGSTTQGEQLISLRQSCGRLLKATADSSNSKQLEAILMEIDGQVKGAIATSLIGSADSDEFSQLVDNLYDGLEKL